MTDAEKKALERVDKCVNQALFELGVWNKWRKDGNPKDEGELLRGIETLFNNLSYYEDVLIDVKNILIKED